MATTQPTPPPNPTIDNEKTLLHTTNQRPKEPVDPQTTDSADENTQSQPSTDYKGTGTEPRLPTTSEIATDLPILRPKPTDIGLIVGIVVIVIVVIAAAVTVVVIIAVLLKKHHGKMTTVAVPTTANQAYGLNTHLNKEVEEINIYNYPEVDLDNITIETKQNDAYGTNTDNIITEGNQVYATNITTEKNAAYKPVTTVEAVNEYDYI